MEASLQCSINFPFCWLAGLALLSERINCFGKSVFIFEVLETDLIVGLKMELLRTVWGT